jgi:hypothetical protein
MIVMYDVLRQDSGLGELILATISFSPVRGRRAGLSASGAIPPR